MTTEKLVNDSLFGKTELAKHEVQLTALDDLKKLASISANQLQTNKKIITIIVGIVDSVNAKLNELDKNDIDNLSLQKNSETIFNNFKKSAQDLGIDYKNTEGFKLHEEILSNALKMTDKKNMIDSVKRLVR
jgi:hypothetical protein